jgi:glycosyltransferase involved in cell wall biosynthesis
MSEKLNVLFVSDLVVPTGFSTVAHNIIKNIEEDFNFTGVGVNYKGDPHDYKFAIFPAVSGQAGNIYGVDRVCNLLNGTKVDLLFILNDAWVISYYLSAIKEHVKKPPKIVVYFPIDSEFHNPEWYKNFDIVNRAFTYTEFGKKVVKACIPEMNVEIIPHGVDTSTIYKLNDPLLKTRTALFGDSAKKIKKLDELFIVLNANRNQPRKKLDITMKGFSLFAEGKDDVRLYMHCGIRDSSIDVSYLAKRYNIDNKLIITNMAQGIQRIDIDKLNIIYNACDVGINTSMGEGWGLTNVDHALTGAAQIVPRHSACEELFYDCGLLMETSNEFLFDNSQTVGKMVSPEEVARCLQVLYNNKELKNNLAEKAMSKFINTKYHWYTIAQKWKEVFLEVCTNNDDTTVPQ